MKRSLLDLSESTYSKPSLLSRKITTALEAEKCYQRSVSDLKDNDQALEIAQSLEDLHLVLKEIKIKSPTEVALIKNIANTAVVGQDLDPSNVIPSMEDFGDSQANVSTLLERVGLILNSYVHSVSESFELLVNFLQSILLLIKENINTIENLRKKFAEPDDGQDDIERSVNFDGQDNQWMITPIGEANTFGDLFNSFKNSRKSFKTLTDVSTIISSRLLDCVRQIIPSNAIDSPEKLIVQLDNAGKSLFENLNQMWETSIGKSSLISARSETGCETFETGFLLGGDKICYAMKRVNVPTNEEISIDARSEIIRSFQLSKEIVVTDVSSQDKLLTGITNKTINLFIEEIKKFVVDLERYVVWCMTTAEMAKSQSTNDIANISRHFVDGAGTSMLPEQAGQMRQSFEKHIVDISSVVKTMVNIATIPSQYANDLLSGLVIIVSKMPQETPVGSYNALK